MILGKELFEELLAEAEASPRRRMHFDLRTNPETERSQRMLNVLMADTVIPIHRHNDTSETVVICRGKVREEFYDENGNKVAEFVMEAGGDCPVVQVPRGQYHTAVCLVDGSVIFEAKDGPYDPETTEDLLRLAPRRGEI